MRIAFLAPSFDAGGVETFVFRLGRYLARAGHAVEIVATDRPGAWFHLASSYGLGASCWPRTLSMSPLAHARRIGRTLARRGYDVCLLNHDRLAQASLAMLPDDVIAIPIVHNDVEPVYRVACGNADAWNVAVAVSGRVAAAARSRVGSRPVVEIPHGVDLPAVDPDRAARLARRPFRLLFAGRLQDSQKGVFCLPPIVAGCRRRGLDVVLQIAGDGPDGAALKRRFAELSVADRVEWLGVVPPSEIAARLVDSHAVVMPSYYEGLGLIMIEAMASSCVPIVSRLAGVTDRVVDPSVGFLVAPGEVEGFVSAVERLYRSEPELLAMSRAARARAEAKFSTDSMGRAYADLLHAARGGAYPLPRARASQPPIARALLHRSDPLPFFVSRYASAVWSALQPRG